MKAPPIVPDQRPPSHPKDAGREMATSFHEAATAAKAFKAAIEPHRLAILLLDS